MFVRLNSIYKLVLPKALHHSQMLLSVLICLVVGPINLATACLRPEQYCLEGPYCFLDGHELVNPLDATMAPISEDLHVCSNHCDDLVPDHNAVAYDSNNVGCLASLLNCSREAARAFASGLQNCPSMLRKAAFTY